jgi:2,3-bisphosphoglycerate-independent phosphoglycerate mutase
MKSSGSNNRHIILFFVDGLGIGETNPDYNPCCHTQEKIFVNNDTNFPQDGKKFALDACLGVSGLPQSGSGQTTIYTGENASQLIGRHLFGFPNRQLRELLGEKSLFVSLSRSKYQCKFMNAFRPVFFTTPEVFRNMRMSATTEMNRAAELPFNTITDITNGRALYHDYTNEVLRRLGFKIPKYSAENAAEILISESKCFDLVLYEFFLTDMAGHTRDMTRAVNVLQQVENLLIALIRKINRDQTILILISDHGNIEDLRTKSHTKNAALMGFWGKNNDLINFDLASLTDIAPLISYILKN